MQHIPVLYQEVLDILNPFPGGLYVDGTVGAGGHSRGILEGSSPDGKLIGFDRDPAGIDTGRKIIWQSLEIGLILIHSSYQN